MPAIINSDESGSENEIDILKKKIEKVPKPKSKPSFNSKHVKMPTIINSDESSSENEIDILKKIIQEVPKPKKKRSANKKPAIIAPPVINDESSNDDEFQVLKTRTEEIHVSPNVHMKPVKMPAVVSTNSSSEYEIDLLKKRVKENTTTVKNDTSFNRKSTDVLHNNDSASEDEIDLMKKRIEEMSEAQPVIKTKGSVNKKPSKRPAIVDDDNSDEDNEIIKPPKKKSKISRPDSHVGTLTPKKNIDTAIIERTPMKKSREKNGTKDLSGSTKNIEIMQSDKKNKKEKMKSISPSKQVRIEKPLPLHAKDHRDSLYKGDKKEKPIHKPAFENSPQKSKIDQPMRPTARAEKQKHSIESSNEIQVKKVKKSTKSENSLTKTKKDSRPKPTKSTSAKKNNSADHPPPAMDWFSAVLASEVQKKQVSRKPQTKSSSAVEQGRIRETKASSMNQNKDVVLAAKFPHKRKLVTASEVLSSSHPKRPAPAPANRTHKKPFT